MLTRQELRRGQSVECPHRTSIGPHDAVVRNVDPVGDSRTVVSLSCGHEVNMSNGHGLFEARTHLDVTAANGVPFRVVFLPEGKDFGAYTKWPQDSEPMVEFYDLRHTKNFGPNGQMVSRYHVDTILGRDEYGGDPTNTGVDLYGGVRDWNVDADTMAVVRAWLNQRVPS